MAENEWLEFEDDEGDEEDVLKQDIVMFMIDYALIDVENSNLFQETIHNIAEFYKAKAISGPKDFTGIYLYRIDSNDNPQSVDGIRLVQPLAQVSVERIIQLEQLASSPEAARQILGNPVDDNGISLPNALWVCAHAFLDSKRKQAYKRLMIFTADDDPHKKSAGHSMATTVRLRDLHQQNVRVELFGFDCGTRVFEYHRFFASAFPETKPGEEQPFRQVSDMVEFSREIKKRRQMKRVLAKLEFKLVENICLAVNVYNLYGEAKRPHFSQVYARTNVAAEPKTRYEPKGPAITAANEPSLPSNSSIVAIAPLNDEIDQGLKTASELVFLFNYGGENIEFTPQELTQIRGLLEPGLALFGFKPIQLLKPHHNIKHSYFIFPDESRITGSTTLFSALLSKMHQHQVFALCSMQIRHSWSPRLVALLPQLEKIDESGFTVIPAGMNAIVLPWADDTRDKPQTALESVNDAEVSIAKKIIERLSLDPFDPAFYLNPSLQLFYNHIEALALEKSEIAPVNDTITPDAGHFSRISGLFGELVTLIPDKTELPEQSATVKRKKVTNGSGDDLVRGMFDQGKLNKATVAQLKNFLIDVGISPAKKKQELLEQVEIYFGN